MGETLLRFFHHFSFNKIKLNIHMKSLAEFIKENKECENCKEKNYETKSFSFNFKDMENYKKALESLSAAATENISYSDDEGNISFTISKDNYSEASAFLTALKDYVKKLGGITVKRASDGAYADKVAKMEKKVEDIDNLIASYSEDNSNDDKKGDENE